MQNYYKMLIKKKKEWKLIYSKYQQMNNKIKLFKQKLKLLKKMK